MATKRTYKNRLKKLRDFMHDEVPPRLLKMFIWMDEDKKGHIHNHASLKCGTPACALGWATCIFPQLYYDRLYGAIRLKGSTKIGTWDAAVELFGLSKEDAHYLFGGHERNPKQEAKAIDEVLARM